MQDLPTLLSHYNYKLAPALAAIGYRSLSTAEAKNTEEYKYVMSDFLKRLEERRDAALARVSDQKLDRTVAKDLVDIVDKLTKNVQLLSGKPTENISHLTSLSDDELAKLAAKHSGPSDGGVGKAGVGT